MRKFKEISRFCIVVVFFIIFFTLISSRKREMIQLIILRLFVSFHLIFLGHQISFRQYNYNFDDEIILYRDVSFYSNLTVAQSGSLRMLRFDLFGTEGLIHLSKPDLILFDYMRFQLLTLLWNFEPERILVIGLGVGILPRILHKLSPSSFIEVVEIDSIVFDLAKKFFDFPFDESIRVFIEDGRHFLERQRSNRYDLILIDAFKTNGQIPHELRTIECLGEFQRVLKSKGLLTMNFVEDNQKNLYRQTFARASFKHLYRAEIEGNFVFIALQKHANVFNRSDFQRRAEILQKNNSILIEFDWREEIQSLQNENTPRFASIFTDKTSLSV